MQDRGQQGRSHPLFFTPNFHQKARSVFLFYKFYKFRGRKALIFNKLRRLKCGLGTEKCGLGTEKCGLGTKLRVYRCDHYHYE
jgi:hypothetical protein